MINKLQRPGFPATSGSNVDKATSDLVVEMMNAGTKLHITHLLVTGVGSYAAHKALNDIYDALPDHADTIAEAYQGASEKLLAYGEVSLPTIRTKDEAVSYLRSLYGKVNNLQSMMPYSEIVNELDNVKSSINSAKYKLIFLQ
jgi:DNA-binding ferritin-like protein